jgi:hypothetical protein
MSDEPDKSPVQSSLGLDACIWTDEPNEKRRAFIVNNFPWQAELKGKGQIRAMERIFQWLKLGTVPEKKKKPQLRTIK